MTESQGLDAEAVLARLPHRFPFLLVDRVLAVTPGRSITALKNVTANEAHFVGHFPMHPVMPGVLVIEAMAQACGLLAWESARLEAQTVTILYLVGIDKARFKLTVTPGDQLILRAQLTKRRQGLWCFACTAEVDSRIAAEADILMAGGKRP